MAIENKCIVLTVCFRKRLLSNSCLAGSLIFRNGHAFWRVWSVSVGLPICLLDFRISLSPNDFLRTGLTGWYLWRVWNCRHFSFSDESCSHYRIWPICSNLCAQKLRARKKNEIAIDTDVLLIGPNGQKFCFDSLLIRIIPLIRARKLLKLFFDAFSWLSNMNKLVNLRPSSSSKKSKTSGKLDDHVERSGIDNQERFIDPTTNVVYHKMRTLGKGGFAKGTHFATERLCHFHCD